MTEVFFYLGSDTGKDALFALTRRIAQAAWQRQRQVYIHCADANQCQALDDWLWQQPAASFLPHATSGKQPIRLGWQEVPADCHDVLINLALAAPDFFSRFERLAEPVGAQENERQAARTRWSFYQSRGYQVQKFDI